MNSRIRYIKGTLDNSFKGNKYYRNEHGQEFEIQYIDLGSDGCVGNVIGVGNDVLVMGITAPSPHKIKILLKKELEARGCVFEKETRSASEE